MQTTHQKILKAFLRQPDRSQWRRTIDLLSDTSMGIETLIEAQRLILEASALFPQMIEVRETGEDTLFRFRAEALPDFFDSLPDYLQTVIIAEIGAPKKQGELFNSPITQSE